MKTAAFVLGLLAALVSVAAVRADGEAGLVIQDGDLVTTYCVAFKGDGIDGDDLLTAAGISFDQFGGGGGRTLCSIRDKGCPNAGSFNDCFCQCSGGSSCTYWAFFTQRYGAAWVYSTAAFNLTRAKDGELQGWKWGRGNLQSAPAPAAITFEQVCGHPPRGLVAATATPLPPTPTLAATPTTSAAATATSTSTSPSPSPSANTPSPAPTTVETATPGSTASPTPFTALPAGGATATVTVGRETPAVSPPATGDDADEGSAGGVLVFGALAVVLGIAGAATIIWRRRHA